MGRIGFTRLVSMEVCLPKMYQRSRAELSSYRCDRRINKTKLCVQSHRYHIIGHDVCVCVTKHNVHERCSRIGCANIIVIRCDSSSSLTSNGIG